MAERLLKKKPRKVATVGRDDPIAPPVGCDDPIAPSVGSRVPRDRNPAAVLVGTYKARQLAWIKRHGIYNYPVREDVECKVENGKCKIEDNSSFSILNFQFVKELWLYADVKGTRHVFEAEFVGIKTRDELVAEYGYPAGAGNGEWGTGKGRAVSMKPPPVGSRVPRDRRAAAPHASRYYIFKTKFLEYGSRLDDPIVIARTADFGGRSAKVKKAIEQFKADGEFAPLTHYLPSDLAQVPRSRLRVCEAAVQYRLVQWSPVVGVSPLLGKIESVVMSIGEFGRVHAISSGEAYSYLKTYKGLEYLDKYHEPLSCFPMESLVDDLTRVCCNNGGDLR